MTDAGRVVTVALCDHDGQMLGALAPIETITPWWMEVGEVLDAAKARDGIDAVVLRLVAAEDRWPPHGGAVTYLAQVHGDLPADVDLAPVAVGDDGDPRRAVWARPGGVDALTEWADGALAAAGRSRLGAYRQVRTWNLSCLLHAEADGGRVWIKAVPPFMAHEPRLLGLLAADSPVAVPPLVAAAPGVSLLEDVGGRDLYDAGLDELVAMVDALVVLQSAWAARPDDLLHAGLADRRGSVLTTALVTLAGRADVRGRLEADECAALDRLVDGLPDRFAAAAACGVPETLVHGDFHPGNWRTDGSRMTLLDWGDASLGHPTIDIATFAAAVERYGAAPDAVGPVRRVWIDAWHREVPGCEPERAASLFGPVAALERALVFRQFLDGIELSEAPYHARDTEEWIRRALDAVRAG